MEFKKYDKIYSIEKKDSDVVIENPEDDIIVTEKVDGGNFRFYISNDGRLIFGSRTQQLTSNQGDDSNVPKDFRTCLEYVRSKFENADEKFIEAIQGYIFFGEAMHKHTINYDWDKTPRFIGFDIYNTNEGKYLNTEDAKEVYDALDITFVPIVWEGKVKDLPKINDDFVPISKYTLESAEDRKAEGIVIKNERIDTRAKYVRDIFKERNGEVFGSTPKYNKVGDTDNADFIFKYVTNARIEKLIWKKIDDGQELAMTMMGPLIRDTYLDIIEEEWKEILTSNWKLDFKKLRKGLAPRVLSVLKNVIINNER